MNPIVQGFYADPEARFYDGRYYIYVTKSFTKYTDQMNIDAFSSSDLIHWEKHENIIDMSGFPYIHRAVWAPTIIEKHGKYYLIFASNDIRSITITRMTVPCCGGLPFAVKNALAISGKDIPLNIVTISPDGKLIG